LYYQETTCWQSIGKRSVSRQSHVLRLSSGIVYYLSLSPALEVLFGPYIGTHQWAKLHDLLGKRRILFIERARN
jgi:hypothetical protein